MKPLSSRNLICPVDPAFIPKYTRDSGRWYPFLDILLQRAADHVSVHQTFFPDLVDLQAELPPEEGGAGESRFIDFFKARESLARACSCFVLRGRIGVGKTSFLKWWLSLGQRADRHAMLNFNVEGKLWRERGNPGMALYLAKRFSEVLNRLADEPSFKKKRSTLIEEIRKRESVFSSSGSSLRRSFCTSPIPLENSSNRWILNCSLPAQLPQRTFTTRGRFGSSSITSIWRTQTRKISLFGLRWACSRAFSRMARTTRRMCASTWSLRHALARGVAGSFMKMRTRT